MDPQIGNNIRKFRELKNITREVMAAELGLTASGYSKIERNEVDLSLSRIYKIARILDVNFNHLIVFDSAHLFNGTSGSDNNLYKEKYIKKLEEENELLKNIINDFLRK